MHTYLTFGFKKYFDQGLCQFNIFSYQTVLPRKSNDCYVTPFWLPPKFLQKYTIFVKHCTFMKHCSVCAEIQISLLRSYYMSVGTTLSHFGTCITFDNVLYIWLSVVIVTLIFTVLNMLQDGVSLFWVCYTIALMNSVALDNNNLAWIYNVFWTDTGIKTHLVRSFDNRAFICFILKNLVLQYYVYDY